MHSGSRIRNQKIPSFATTVNHLYIKRSPAGEDEAGWTEKGEKKEQAEVAVGKLG
jgi:hypothetical protein